MSGTEGYWLIFGLALMAALSWFVVTAGDAHSFHQARATQLRILETLASSAQTDAQRKDLAETVATFPIAGIKALTRGLIALLVVTALLYVLLLLFGSGSAVDSDLMKQALTALLTTLTAIVAFYFGSRAADSGGQDGPKAADAGSGEAPPPSPTISGFFPAGGPPGTDVEIKGSGLEATSRVRFGQTPAVFRFNPDAQAVKTSVPVGSAKGKIKIEITSAGGTGSSEDDFDVT